MRGLTIQDIAALTMPQRGVSGAINPDAARDFKKLHLAISTGYNIAGLEPQNCGSGSFVLLAGAWKYRGG